jgi:hypothetical protein
VNQRRVVIPRGTLPWRQVLSGKFFSMTEGYTLLVSRPVRNAQPLLKYEQAPGARHMAPWQVLDDANLDTFGRYMRCFMRTEVIESCPH